MFKLTSLIKEMKHISKVNYELTWAGPQKIFMISGKIPFLHILTRVFIFVNLCTIFILLMDCVN